MSTRSNIEITDGTDSFMFYRHSDGYPSGQETLLKFMKLIQDKKLRDDVQQCAGWLIVFGHEEYGSVSPEKDWKVGAYEPSIDKHGDINYFYKCDILKMTIEVYNPDELIGTITKFDNVDVLKNIEKDN